MLLAADDRFLLHETGPFHPERPSRLTAVARGLEIAGLGDVLVPFSPRPATTDEIELVHAPSLVSSLARLAELGGGDVDADTVVGPESFEAARLAAGAGLDAAERLEAGGGDFAFLALRPPGHHARPGEAMGFCLLNNVAITAASLAGRGQRVAIVDYDAHHGNGTQEVFYGRGDVLYVSVHQHPLYPGTGRSGERGSGSGVGATLNIPLPAGAAGDTYRAAFDELVVPAVGRFSPDWLLVSAGFDAHRADPLTDLGLTAGDFADLSARLVGLVPPGRTLVFLEGGYDLSALAASAGAAVGAFAGADFRPEPASSAGPGREVVDRLVAEQAREQG